MTPQAEKVLFLLASLDGGGAQRVFSVLLRHLDRKQFELHLGLLQAQGPFLKDLPDDVVVHELGSSRARSALPSLVQLIRQLNPRVVLTTQGHMNLLLMMASPFLPRGTRLLIRESATASVILSDYVSRPRLWRALYRRLYRRADAIICLSDAMVEDLAVQFGLPRAKLVRIYNPVDVEQVRRLAACGPSPYSGPGPHLVAAGRLSHEKGFDLLIAAMPAVCERFPQATLTILGDGSLAAELGSQAQKLGVSSSVRLPGFVNNPWPYFKNANVFVLPSRCEGLPNVVLEALAIGVPIVATDCPGATLELKSLHHGIVVVPANRPEAWARAIVSVCEPGARESRESALVLDKFGVEQVVREYSNLLLG